MGISLLFEKTKHWKKYTVITVGMLLGIELVQFFGRLGSFDIDDFLLNLAGAMLGFCIWKTKIFQWLDKYL